MLRPILISLSVSATLMAPANAEELKPADVLVTAEQLRDAKKTADDLFASGNCEAALPALDALVKKANTHANLIYAGARSVLENPRENAGSEAISNQIRSPLRDYAAALRVRDEGWVSIAECMVKVGRPDAAVGAYLQALSYISASDQRETWQRARIGLWKLIGVLN